MSRSEACPFCDQAQSYRYVKELAYARIVYPKSAVVPYHVLITPKRHVRRLDQLTQREVRDMYQLIRLLAKHAQVKLKAFIGYNILSNNGSELVRQRVQHAHVHIFLRRMRDPDPFAVPRKAVSDHLNAREKRSLKDLQDWFTNDKNMNKRKTEVL